MASARKPLIKEKSAGFAKPCVDKWLGKVSGPKKNVKSLITAVSRALSLGQSPGRAGPSKLLWDRERVLLLLDLKSLLPIHLRRSTRVDGKEN
jgi:hypothetical protein